MRVRHVFAAPLVLTAALAHADTGKVRFDGYQCYSGPPDSESSVTCPQSVLPKAKKGQPVIQDGDACYTFQRKQVRCPPNLIAPDASGAPGVFFDENTFGCMKEESMQCPPDATCNPPPPQPMACPDALLPKLAKKVKPTRKKGKACYYGKVKVVCP